MEPLNNNYNPYENYGNGAEETESVTTSSVTETHSSYEFCPADKARNAAIVTGVGVAAGYTVVPVATAAAGQTAMGLTVSAIKLVAGENFKNSIIATAAGVDLTAYAIAGGRLVGTGVLNSAMASASVAKVTAVTVGSYAVAGIHATVAFAVAHPVIVGVGIGLAAYGTYEFYQYMTSEEETVTTTTEIHNKVKKQPVEVPIEVEEDIYELTEAALK